MSNEMLSCFFTYRLFLTETRLRISILKEAMTFDNEFYWISKAERATIRFRSSREQICLSHHSNEFSSINSSITISICSLKHRL